MESPNTGRVKTYGDPPRFSFIQGGETIPNPKGDRLRQRNGRKWWKPKVPKWMKNLGKKFKKRRDDDEGVT